MLCTHENLPSIRLASECDFVNNSSFGEDGKESINWNAIGGSSRAGDTVPEPDPLVIFGTALIGFAALRRRRS
jgi:hypothetical protein